MVNDAILNFVINKINLLLKFGTKIGMMSNGWTWMEAWIRSSVEIYNRIQLWIFRFLPFALI